MECNSSEKNHALLNILAGHLIVYLKWEIPTIAISERPLHLLVAHIHMKRHAPDNKLDKAIDLDTQYVKLKLISSKEIGAMHRDKLERRPDLYQQGIESHEGQDICDEDLIDDKKTDNYVLIRGRAGIGKSTLLQRLMWKWATGEWATKFKVIFMLNLRYLVLGKQMTLPRLLSLYSVYNTGNPDVIFTSDWLEENQSHVGFILGESRKPYLNQKQISLHLNGIDSQFH